jgi:hypothetical protein
MSKRQPIIIGDRIFKTQKEALGYYRCMLGQYRNNQIIQGQDSDDLAALLERHPEAVDKIGCGVKKFYKAPTTKGTSCFWIERRDGTKTDFSFYSCVQAKTKSLYQEFSDACREAVHDDLTLAKKKFFELYGDDKGLVICEVTGESVAIYESHLDHKKPLTFQVIVRTFLQAQDINPSRKMLSTGQDAQFTTTFVDQEIEAMFRNYHRKVADLRILKAKINLSLGCCERIRKSRNPVLIPE